MTAWLLYILLLASGAFSLLLILLTWPGLWLMLAAAALYALFTHARFLGMRTLAVIAALSLAAEAFELLSAKHLIGRAGGGKHAAIGAAVGGVVGGIFLTLIPIPILSTIVGICLGTFLGAALGELYGSQRPDIALSVGLGAAKARLWALAVKLTVGFAIFFLILCTAFP